LHELQRGVEAEHLVARQRLGRLPRPADDGQRCGDVRRVRPRQPPHLLLHPPPRPPPGPRPPLRPPPGGAPPRPPSPPAGPASPPRSYAMWEPRAASHCVISVSISGDSSTKRS